MPARHQEDFFSEFYKKLVEEAGNPKVIETELPDGVTAQLRSDGKTQYIFLMNFNNKEVTVQLPESMLDLLRDEKVDQSLSLNPYG